MLKGLCVGNKEGIKKAYCQECGAEMSFQEGGYSDTFTNGVSDQIEFSDCWVCPDCKHVEEI